jgi:hypothetical protein
MQKQAEKKETITPIINSTSVFLGKEDRISWDDAYKQLEQKLRRVPNVDEVQRRLLEMAEVRI